MSKENILRITLFVSVLAFNPVVAETFESKINIQSQQNNSVSASIANILYKRGLDEDAAKEISQKFVTEDEELFARMIENLLHGYDQISRDELLAYLSNEALFRKSVSLECYDDLVGMVREIKQTVLNENTLKRLHIIAKQNQQLLV